MANRLAHEASPYLKQHAQNPVDWYPWGPEALERARLEDKPILLSIGYSACHWCHVMEHESFSDAGIAKLMNEHFVSIKVDREERPDIDQIYQLVVQLLGRSGGWPLTVFLTPAQKPFFAGTYFPPVDRHGMPAFPRILEAVAEAYREKRDDIELQSAEIAQAIAQVTRLDAKPGTPSRESLAKAAARLEARFDDAHGGFGSRPKFPSTMSLDVLLHHGALGGDERALGRVKKALDGMRAGGIYDHLGGGFHRYSTDERWLVPHFEKMLYDNALLLRLYTDGWRVFRDEQYARVVRETADYLAREMTSEGGAFYATQDADSEGHEGRFFVWTMAEVKEACGDDAPLACARFGVTVEGNFETLKGASVLSEARSVADLAVQFSMAPSEVEKRLTIVHTSMFAFRERRPKPFRDEKILTSWNALLIGALADASRALGEPAWLAMATRAFDYVWRTLTKDGRALRHTIAGGAGRGKGFLDDHAFLGCAAVDLYETTGDGSYLARASELAKTIRDHFEAHGILYFTPDDGEPLIARTEDIYDHSVPSATSMAILLFARLGALASTELGAVAGKLIEPFAGAAVENPFGLAQMVLLVDRVARGTTDVVLVGARALPELARATFEAYVPHRNVAWLEASGEPAASPAAFVCRDHSCSPATLGYRELLALLSAVPRSRAST